MKINNHSFRGEFFRNGIHLQYSAKNNSKSYETFPELKDFFKDYQRSYELGQSAKTLKDIKNKAISGENVVNHVRSFDSNWLT